ncbi:HNH endonuclease [Chloroflexota bacterium]
MKYWWVNQNQTHAQEIPGGYMWSPKQKRDGTKNVFYDNMAKVLPGDLVFSFFDTLISYVGIITSHGYTEPKPDFGGVGEVWGNEGWMVNVDYRKLNNKIQPREHIEVLMPLLPNKYSPLQKNGNGNQVVYLANIPELLAEKIAELIGKEFEHILLESKECQGKLETDQEAEAERIEKLIRKNKGITETEKEVLIKARKGQGKFRDDVLSLHKQCPFTGVSNPIFLTAGHLKPWSRCSDNQERLDPLNGLPLSPVADQLVDQGFVTFDDNGIAVFSHRAEAAELKAMGISLDKTYQITIFDPRQLKYLKYHRDTFLNKNT